MITLTIRSTHYYLIDALPGKLMVDAGWPGTLPALASQLRRYQLDLDQIRYVMITHHHPDHAGLTQEIKQASHARLVILEHQIPYLENLKAFYAGKGSYVPIQIDKNDLVLAGSNRETLMPIGIQGEIVRTPGHSEGSVSLVLDDGSAFIGDLHPVDFAVEEARAVTCESWKKLVRHKAQMVYPAHGNAFPIEAIKRSLATC